MDQTIQVVYMTIYIHVPKKMKKKLFLRYKVSHMEIDYKEQKAHPRGVGQSVTECVEKSSVRNLWGQKIQPC
jgi:hypothetical protein